MNDRIQEIRERLVAITPGWKYNGNEIVLESNLRCGIGGFLKDEDNQFAVNAPADTAYLLSEVERLQTKLNEAMDAMETTYSYVREERYRLAECELEDFLSHLKG